MGALIWSDWGRLVAMCSGLYTLWAGIWGLMFRKYIWDFIGGTLGPVGIIPPIEAKFFISIIVDKPIVQILCIVLGTMTLLIEWPVAPTSFLYRSLPFKLVLYIFAGFFSGLVYQTLDAAAFYLIAILAYGRAISKGEIVSGSGQDNRGKAGTV